MENELVLTIIQAVAAVAAIAVASWAAIQSRQTGKVLDAVHDLLEDFNIAFGVKAGMEGGIPYLIAYTATHQMKELVRDGIITEEQAVKHLTGLLVFADEMDKEKLKDLFREDS